MDEKRRNIFARLMDEAGLPPEEALQMVQGASEVGLSVLTGLAGVAAGLPGSAIQTALGRGTEEQQEKYPGLGAIPEDTLLPTVGEMAEKWTYQPRTETGQQYAENVGEFMAPVDKALRAVSGFAPGIAEKVPGDSRLGSGVLNAVDQAIYTALNVMSPTKGAGTGLMLGAKGAQAAMRGVGAKNLDLVTPTAQAIEKAPIIKRYNQINHAMGQLITRKQLAGLQPGVVQGSSANVGGWYSGAKLGHLKEMAKTAAWNVGRKMTDNQDAWLRAHYGITANVYKELERLGRVMDRADQQAKAKGGAKNLYKDEDGSNVLKEGTEKPMTVQQVRSEAANQYHAQIAYNRSVLEKYKPGDPRIERLAGGELDKYLTPKHKQTSIDRLKSDPSIIKDLLGRNIDDDVVSNHIASKISSDMRLKGNNVHISTKPFFFASAANALAKPKTGTGLPQPSLLGRTIVRDGRKIKVSNKTHAFYAHGLRNFVAKSQGQPITKQSVIDHFKELNKHIPDPKNRYDIEYVRKSVVDDGDWISISQWALTDDTLLATIPMRVIINKNNPKMGYYVMYDQMKQGSGIPILEDLLDAGSDTNRIYLDIQPIDKDFTDWSGYTPRVHKTTPAGPEAKLREMATPLRKEKFDAPPTEEFLKRRRWGRLPIGIEQAAMFGSPAKRGAGIGLLAQDENI